ncbi:Gfo/Idh/MocA family oxidoreductase [Zafaria sp. J156]|uniref:Gfo/Idh/MocA family oxidoreductase n=1 Tax=Zafaria sp. J156 TaxID=3116490 RepID=UPI002E79C115|nr:Gfo/Idh/MocA family oxidoreductase [Zafaria sp. J156]MEE1620710.1 Gfo/Idh/MocA family oxidoreductase [Zafaria sp. J156]
MTPLRVGLVGLGMMGRHHARVLRALDGVELVAVADATGDVHQAAPGVPLHPDVEGLIAHGIDAAVCAVPTGLHEQVGLRLAEAGVHTLFEKPVAAGVDEGRRLRTAFEQAGLVGAVGHIERFNPAVQELKRQLAAGEIGRVVQIATRRQGPFPGRIADVGVVKDLGTHDIDLTAWLGGSPYAWVAGHTARATGRSHEDLMAATGALADKTAVNHVVNWLSPFKERIVVVTGEGGTLVADTVATDLTLHENGVVKTEWDAIAISRGVSEGRVIRLAFPKAEPLRIELEAFVRAVNGDATGIVGLGEGVATLAVAEAVLRSAETRRVVEIATEGTGA